MKYRHEIDNIEYAGYRIEPQNGNHFIVFRVGEEHRGSMKRIAQELKISHANGKKRLCLGVTPYTRKRSLDANAYCWLLITEIANVLRASKEEVYLMMLKRYGQGGAVKIPKEQEHMFIRAYPYNEPMMEDVSGNKEVIYYRFWVGSSQYDTREMSILIDGIVNECHEMGIETKTPEELEKIKSEWKQDEKHIAR